MKRIIPLAVCALLLATALLAVRPRQKERRHDMAAFVVDTFTGSAGTALTSHTGETGATWTALIAGAASPVLTDSNRLRGDGVGEHLYVASGSPADANHSVAATFRHLSVAGNSAGVAVRASADGSDCYLLIYFYGDGQWQLYKRVGGSFTLLGSASATLSVGDYAVVLSAGGTTIKATVNGTEVISVTDSAVSAAGKTAVWFNGASTDSTGLHIADFQADDVAVLAAGTPSVQSATASGVTVTSTAASGGAGLKTYQWYRSATANFTPGAGNILSGATTLTHADTTATTGVLFYYKLVVTDAASDTATSREIAGQRLAGSSVVFGGLGDSITYGEGLSAGENPLSRMAVHYGRLRQVSSQSVVNEAISGHDTADWIPDGSDYPGAAESFASGGVTHTNIMLGANDAYQGVTAAAYKANLQEIIDAEVEAGRKVILHYPTFIPDGANGGVTTAAAVELARQYRLKIDELVDGVNVLRGDTLAPAIFANGITSLTQADRTHPNATGADVLGSLWAAAADRSLNASAASSGGSGGGVRRVNKGQARTIAVELAAEGLSPTCEISKAGGAFASAEITITALDGRWYSAAMTASHTDTSGDLVLRFSDGTSVLMDVRPSDQFTGSL